ncbi:MAG: hypothetical protein GY829_11750 [Gammaproteobacteria bacterium]|nr:hypothetical protein [Gammaproteobacteria bacterium]
MNLRFDESQIERIASQYEYPREETDLMQLPEIIQHNGFLNKEQLQLVAKWKSPRSAKHVEKNTNEYIKDVTSFAFSTSNERSRIESLVIIDGVSWPTASVLLHLFHADPYPILDFRALWSANLEKPKQYSYSFWQPYVSFCREVAKRNNVSMRELDRAMWQYSKENQQA